MRISATRRGVLALFGAAPLAGPAAAKAMIERQAMDLAGVSLRNWGGGGCAPPSGSGEPELDKRRFALNIPAVRREVESLLYENQRDITRIDPDIGVYRSFSLNAKIAFQRQRNVERELRQMQNEFVYRRVWNVINSARGVLGL